MSRNFFILLDYQIQVKTLIPQIFKFKLTDLDWVFFVSENHSLFSFFFSFQDGVDGGVGKSVPSVGFNL